MLPKQAVSGRAWRGLLLVLGVGLLAACAGRPPETPPIEAPAAPPERAWSARAFAELRTVATETTHAHGLNPETDAIEALAGLDRAAMRNADAARAFDSAADELFARLALTFATGAVDPSAVDPEWAVPRAAAPDVAKLTAMAANGAAPAGALDGLLPSSSEYLALLAELARVRAEPERALDAAGLSREDRIDRLRVNLERWRWLQRDLPLRRVDVLIPLFELRMRDTGAATPHAVIVGARRTPTPSFAAVIDAVTLNPPWTPPASIATDELLPRFRRDPGAAAREGFDVLDSAGRVIDPAEVNWRTRLFPYTLRQRPGAGNALGRLRFDLPNPYAVYLHDTPSRGLFARADRALSHGCIRVAAPVSLAVAALADPAWDEAALEAAIEEGATRALPLSAPLPVYVLYLTAMPDESGVVKYAEDIYRRDAAVLRALDQEETSALVAQSMAPETECSAMQR